jgi:ABC-type branched-subunit amino acid transport system ATPase component/predicted MFS family arabinose efflux permease
MSPVTWVKRQFEDVSGGMLIFPLVVLFFLYFFDEFDTAAFGTLVPEIQKAFHLSDSRFALIVILNVSVVLLAAIPLGYWGDRLPRTKLVVAGAVLAGLFSFGTGLAVGVGVLFLVRIGNGFGVIVNDPIHRSLLTDYYRPIDRPQVFAMHANGQRLAGVVGPSVAGIAAALAGWRAAFLILIVPILIMAVVAGRLKNPVRGGTEDPESAEAAAEERPVPFGRAARMLFNVKTLRRQYIAWLFIGAGFLPLAFELPLFFKRAFGLGPFERGLIGSVTAAAGFAGVLLAGRWTAGWFTKGLGEPLKRAGWSLVAVGPGLVLLAASPTLWMAVPVAIVTTFIGGIFTPAFFTTQAFVSPARVRSQSFSFGLLFIVTGVWLLWLNPILGIASISDHQGIRWEIFALFPFWVIGGLVLRSGHKFVAADTTRAHDVLVTTAELRKARQSLSERSILVVRGLDVSYGPVQVLFGVDFELQEGEIVALLGTNGAGKSTLLRAISGLVPAQSGAIYFDGEEVTGLEPEDSFAMGLVQVPGGRGIFPGLTVKENLDVAGWATRRPKDEIGPAIREVLDIFPALERRYDQPAGVLSGGEQQMLTLAQAFIAKPRLLMIDELSLGLAPVVVEELLNIVRRIHDEGTSVILVEQSVNLALTVADRACFMEKGEVRFSGPTSELLHRDDILRAVFLTGTAALEHS